MGCSRSVDILTSTDIINFKVYKLFLRPSHQNRYLKRHLNFCSYVHVLIRQKRTTVMLWVKHKCFESIFIVDQFCSIKPWYSTVNSSRTASWFRKFVRFPHKCGLELLVCGIQRCQDTGYSKKLRTMFHSEINRTCWH